MDNHPNNPPAQGPIRPALAIDTAHAITLPVIEEAVHVGKREVETGVVTVTREVTEQTRPVHVVLSHDECVVEHVPAGYYVEHAPETRTEGDTMIVPVLREDAVVVKKIYLVEEIRITRKAIQTTKTEQVPVRREDIRVTRANHDGTKESL